MGCEVFSVIVSRLDIFGSAVREDFDPSRSDLDFLVEFNNFTVADARQPHRAVEEIVRSFNKWQIRYLSHDQLKHDVVL